MRAVAQYKPGHHLVIVLLAACVGTAIAVVTDQSW